MYTTWDAPTRRIVAVALAVLLVLLLFISRPVLPYLIVATLIAYILAPGISFLRNRLRFPKIVAILVSYLLLILVLLLLVVVLVPTVVASFEGVSFNPVGAVQAARDWLIDSLESVRNIRFLDFSFDFSPAVDPALDALTGVDERALSLSPERIVEVATAALDATVNVAVTIFDTLAAAVFSLGLTFLYALYMSAGTGGMRKEIRKWIPPNSREELTILGGRVEMVWSAFLRGQLKLGIIIFAITWVVGLIIGLPAAFALAIIAGLLEFVPNLGPFLAAIPAVLVALLQGSNHLEVTNATFALIVIGAYVVIQQLENNLIVPRVLGRAVEIPPLAVLTGVVVGLSIGGILGAFIAVPIIASGREIVRYTYYKLLEQDPFPPEEDLMAPGTGGAEPTEGLWGRLKGTFGKGPEEETVSSGEAVPEVPPSES